MLAVFRRRGRLLLPLLVLVPAILFAGRLSELHYQNVERPRLLAASPSAQPCSAFASQLPNRAPRSCDLARSEAKPDGAVIEHFYFNDSSRLAHTARDGRWRGSSAECTTASRLGNVAVLGFVVLAVAVLAHSLRTGQWFFFPGMEREPMNDFESVLGIYGVAIIGSQLVALAGATCTAMALV
jgi:hypothetical protein